MANFPNEQVSPHAIANRIAGNSGDERVRYEGAPAGAIPGKAPNTAAFSGYETEGINTSTPSIKDVGLSTGGQATTQKVKEANANPSQHISGEPAAGNTRLGSNIAPEAEGVVQQAVGAVQAAAIRAQEASQPYIQKVQEATTPYVSAAVEKAGPALNQAKDYAAQGYSSAAAELDRRGVTRESAQQKLADVGQNLKNYGVVGQERAGDYFQQAVDQAKTIGSDTENKNIIATVFGTIALIWLAFGFSLGALLSLGIAGVIAAILSRYSSRAPSGPAPSSTQRPVVETHYPNPGHPDNSLNARK